MLCGPTNIDIQPSINMHLRKLSTLAKGAASVHVPVIHIDQTTTYSRPPETALIPHPIPLLQEGGGTIGPPHATLMLRPTHQTLLIHKPRHEASSHPEAPVHMPSWEGSARCSVVTTGTGVRVVRLNTIYAQIHIEPVQLSTRYCVPVSFVSSIVALRVSAIC